MKGADKVTTEKAVEVLTAIVEAFENDEIINEIIDVGEDEQLTALKSAIDALELRSFDMLGDATEKVLREYLAPKLADKLMGEILQELARATIK